MVEEGGFEPPKRDATDLQSAPFGHSGTPPDMELVNGRSRASRVSTACGTAAAPFLSENLPPADFPNDKTLSGPFPNSWMYKRRKAVAFHFFICGAGERTRTPDLLITNQLLYQLSYTSMEMRLFFECLITISFFADLVKQIFFICAKICARLAKSTGFGRRCLQKQGETFMMIYKKRRNKEGDSPCAL